MYHDLYVTYLLSVAPAKQVSLGQHVQLFFLLQGAPLVLQSDNGKEFVAKVIHELKLLWPKCKLVNGRPR